MESEKSQRVPPIPEKGQKIDNSRSEYSPSHYDILPHRKSLPMQSEATKSPEYDVLPLRTFHNTPH